MDFDVREVKIILDTYDDIFSDFDPRPYSQRELSDDFVKEIQRRYLETPAGKIVVHFDMPAGTRDPKTDALVKRRIRDYFEVERKREEKLVREMQNKGVKYVVLGSIALVGATLPLLEWPNDVWVNTLSAIVTPMAWYLSFTGTSMFLDDWRSTHANVKLYSRFEKANYVFADELITDPKVFMPLPQQV